MKIFSALFIILAVIEAATVVAFSGTAFAQTAIYFFRIAGVVLFLIGGLFLIAFVISAIMDAMTKKYGDRKSLGRLMSNLVRIFAFCLIFGAIFLGIALL